MHVFFRLFLIGLFLLVGVPSAFAFGTGMEQGMDDHEAPALPTDQVYTLSVPVFSPLFEQTPVALVKGRPITLGEVTAALPAEVRESSDPARLNSKFNEVLDRLVAVRLDGGERKEVEVFVNGKIDKDQVLTLKVPIFSQHFLFTPVAEVDGDAIPMGEFTRELNAMHAESGGDNHHDKPGELLDRLVTIRLVEREARNIGFDQTDSFKKQVKDFAERTLLYELLNRRVEGLVLDDEEVDRIYHDISLAARLRSYQFNQQEHAAAFIQALEEGADFDQLIREKVEEGVASGGADEDFVPFKQLRSQVASHAKDMEIGEVSKMFKVDDNFIVFKLEDRKFIEDPAALEVARKIAWDQKVADETEKYINEIIDEYAVFDEKAREDFNFTAFKEENPDAKLSDALLTFFDDRRTLVTVEAQGQVHMMQVRELADKVKETYFHGTDIDLNGPEADKRAKQILDDWIFRIAGKAEALEAGLDQTQRYQLKVEEFERRTLFDMFIQKAVVNDIKLTEEEIRASYDDNIEDHSTPAMVRMKSLAFDREDDAFKALDKLKRGSDFKWVSGNSEGLADVDDKDLLDFESGIISMTSLPREFQENSENIRSGSSMLYSDPGKLHYVIFFEKVYPPEPKPYDQVRSQILKEVFQKHVNDGLENYVEQLKRHYPTKVFLSFENN